jgi:hypothetical protein
MTQTSGQPSVIFVVDTVTGYPEISYFKTALFDAKVNADNQLRFKDVNLYIDPKKNTVNYEYLFNLTD